MPQSSTLSAGGMDPNQGFSFGAQAYQPEELKTQLQYMQQGMLAALQPNPDIQGPPRGDSRSNATQSGVNDVGSYMQAMNAPTPAATYPLQHFSSTAASAAEAPASAAYRAFSLPDQAAARASLAAARPASAPVNALPQIPEGVQPSQDTPHSGRSSSVLLPPSSVTYSAEGEADLQRQSAALPFYKYEDAEGIALNHPADAQNEVHQWSAGSDTLMRDVDAMHDQQPRQSFNPSTPPQPVRAAVPAHIDADRVNRMLFADASPAQGLQHSHMQGALQQSEVPADLPRRVTSVVQPQHSFSFRRASADVWHWQVPATPQFASQPPHAADIQDKSMNNQHAHGRSVNAHHESEVGRSRQLTSEASFSQQVQAEAALSPWGSGVPSNLSEAGQGSRRGSVRQGTGTFAQAEIEPQFAEASLPQSRWQSSLASNSGRVKPPEPPLLGAQAAAQKSSSELDARGTASPLQPSVDSPPRRSLQQARAPMATPPPSGRMSSLSAASQAPVQEQRLAATAAAALAQPKREPPPITGLATAAVDPPLQASAHAPAAAFAISSDEENSSSRELFAEQRNNAGAGLVAAQQLHPSDDRSAQVCFPTL